MGVLGDASPASPATLTTLYVMPTTSFFLCCGMKGMWSSNHWALFIRVAIRELASKSLISTMVS